MVSQQYVPRAGIDAFINDAGCGVADHGAHHSRRGPQSIFVSLAAQAIRGAVYPGSLTDGE
jgi:hypothetical protein